ncbi:Choline-sulfatase [Minicystis rosea]|nr:Choline-sulfatase [Minicystis rosea]
MVSALVVPAVCLAGDLFVRGARFPRDGLFTYAAGAVLSLMVWGFCMEAARHPRRAVRTTAIVYLGVIAAFGIGLQVVVRTFTHAYLGRRALLLALGIPNIAESSYIAHNAPKLLAACLVPAIAVVALARARARWLGPHRRRPWLVAAGAGLAITAATFAPLAAQGLQCLPPDVLLLHGTGGPLLYAFGLQDKPKALPVGRHEALPEVSPAPADAPSIVLIFGESVRRDAVCGARAAGCDRSPAVDAAAPDRIGYARAISPASCTELASASLWTGLPPTTPPAALSRAPLIWDWARARGYRTAYVTSQNLLFQQMDLFLRGHRLDLLREARHRDISAHIDDGSLDEDTTGEAVAFLDAAPGPAFVIVHHANTHAPYRQAPGFTPHAGDDRLTRYRNSLVHEDAIVADLITRIRQSERGKRAIILYTSDHGEAWGEHGASYHSFDLYAEQVDVPLWIDVPQGSLPEATIAHLRRDAATRPVTVVDVTATIVDLTGGFDAPGLRERAAALSGTSLLRDPKAGRDVFLWNCPPTRECATDSFGVVRFPLKLHWVGHDQRYVCSDLEADPTEARPLPDARCAALRPVLDGAFGRR